jgi:transposase-like protein
MERERTAQWAVLLAIMVSHLGLSLRRTASLVAPFGVFVSHVAIWYWLQKGGQRAPVSPEDLPAVVVLDETWIKVGGREAWIFTAFDPQTWRVLSLEPFARRTEKTVQTFLRHLAQRYGGYGAWPKEVITDGGRWYAACLGLLSYRKGFRWRIVKGGVRSAIEGFSGEFLKRRLKDFDCYCPSRAGLRSLRNWLWAYSWLHNEIKGGHYIVF